jgi:hypothetical protein
VSTCGKKRILVRVTKNLGLAEDRAREPYEEINLWDEANALSRPDSLEANLYVRSQARPAASMRSGRGSNLHLYET